LSRNRPFFNSVWLDDLFMSLPALVQMGRYGSDRRYYDEACRQFKLFAEKMFVPGQGLFRHAWVQGMDSHPDFFWGRANGWALMTLVEILEVLPESHPQRAYLLDMLRAQIKALAALQSPEGLWHQLLDRNDTYLETSASAIFCYAFAKAINRGWVDAQAYGPAVLLAWNAVAAKVDAQGMVQGTCVGTGMAFDPAFYAHRPVSPYAAHGYGPVLLAGAEVLRLLENFHPKMNDSAVQFYTHHFNTTAPIFEERIENNHGLKVPGYSRRGRRPVVFTIGDSTVRNSDGSGRNGQWGWGNFLGDFLNPDSFSVENHALGGRSSRTFIEEGLWQRVLDVVEEGDYVLMQFGHNDGGEPHRGRARATLKGNGDQAESFVMESTGDTILVHTYGWYMRRYIQDVLDKKAVPVVCSLIPRNIWQDGKVGRNDDTYALWAQQAAESIEGAYFIDLNKLICDKYDVLGKNFVNTLYYGDHTHTSELGAKMNAAIVAEEFKRLIQEK
jgi:lysophospholipase L1-like esterase